LFLEAEHQDLCLALRTATAHIVLQSGSVSCKTIGLPPAKQAAADYRIYLDFAFFATVESPQIRYSLAAPFVG
jgi:hypothetical protein